MTDRTEEILDLVRRTAGEDDEGAAFMEGLLDMAKLDVMSVLYELYRMREDGRLVSPTGELLVSYTELAALGRRLSSAAILVAGEEEA